MTQQEALQILKTGTNVFLTGEPGSGKSYTVRKYVTYLREQGLTPALTASTGIAATHIGGMTLHSWSGLGIRKVITRAEAKDLATNATVRRRVREAAVLIVDEVSMLDAAMLEAVDVICRVLRGVEAPFGGVQVVFVGDFFQLPPVSRPGEPLPRFAFTARAWQEAGCTVCYLTEQHRQEDATFLSILSALRSQEFAEEHHAVLERRQRPPKDQDIPKLYTHNTDVDRVNEVRLKRLPGKEHAFTMTTYGNAKAVEQLKKGCLSPERLVLKVGARVMFTRNNVGQGYMNGSLGEVLGFDPTETWPVVRLLSGKEVTVAPEMWALDGDTLGTALAALRQVPLRLAWAMTVHKSQGMSLDAAHIDLRGAFAYGQGYVALSRIRSLKGLYLEGLNPRALQVDPEVVRVDGEFRAQSQMAARELRSLGAEALRERQAFFVAANVRAPKETKKKKPKWAATLLAFQTGKSIVEVAAARERTVGTILDHLQEMAQVGALPAQLLDRLKQQEWELLAVVGPVIAAQQTPALKPVYEHFQGRYSYDQLKIAQWLSK